MMSHHHGNNRYGVNLTQQQYQAIIKRVIENCRDTFSDEGLDEHTLQELKQLWIEKLKQTGALVPPRVERRPVYHGGYQQQRQVVPRPMGQIVQGQQVLVQQGGAQVRPITVNRQYVQYRPAQPGQPQRVIIQGGQRIQQGGQVRHVIPQQGVQRVVVRPQQRQQQQHVIVRTIPAQNMRQNIQYDEHDQQLDGNQYDGPVDVSSDDLSSSDSESDEAEDEDPNAVDEPPLDDGDDVTEADADEAFETDNVIICQYEKVVRKGNRWRIHLKDGVMHLNGRDYLFNVGSGETDW